MALEPGTVTLNKQKRTKMANQYLKSVRTRFRNTLKKENEIANNKLEEFTLAENEGSEIDKEALTEKLERSMEKNSPIP